MTPTRFDPDRPARVTVFVGPYGCGKSEISVNYARWLSALGHRVLLADLDTVNPFYRSADAAGVLAKDDVTLIRPHFANTNVDVPALGGEVHALFDDHAAAAVLDVGGEAAGIRALAALEYRMVPEETRILMVVNRNRPESGTAEALDRQIRELESAGRCRIAGLVDNTHLLEPVAAQDAAASLHATRTLARGTGKPVLFRSILEDQDGPPAWRQLDDGTWLFVMRRSIFYDY